MCTSTARGPEASISEVEAGGGSARPRIVAEPRGIATHDLEQGLARETLCRLLAACHYQPAPEFGEERVFETMRKAAGRVDPDLLPIVRRIDEDFTSRGPGGLLVDYTRLFLGPAAVMARPYGSAWLETLPVAMGDSTLAVQRLYREGGFDLDDGFRELPDHIAAELEFLYLLIYCENRARRDGDTDRLNATIELKGRFLGQHLGRWVGPFTNAVHAGAESDFYRALAELTDRFVGLETNGGRLP
jgi:TorA maturation chaperone TorD